MTKCLNCGAALSCGCQKRVASDGKQVCTNCASNYEQKLQQLKGQPQQTPTKNSEPSVSNVSLRMYTPAPVKK